ncbi:MAG: hypothetical protein ACYC3X_31460 [Pirellulaceae bacterium]
MRFFISLTIAHVVMAMLPTTQQRSTAGQPSDVERLAQTCLNRARSSYDFAWIHCQPFDLGKSDPEQVYRWSRRWMEAELLTVHSTTERIAATKSHLDRMKRLEAEVAGDGTRSTISVDIPATQFYCAEAELWLAEIKMK